MASIMGMAGVKPPEKTEAASSSSGANSSFMKGKSLAAGLHHLQRKSEIDWPSPRFYNVQRIISNP